ncbi:hypothetical protein Tco_1398325, partial [Tanacetum coccineum]
PAIADILIEELIEKADGFAGVFPGSDITSVVPRAQMNQQWFRQFKSALDTDMQDETNSKGNSLRNLQSEENGLAPFDPTKNKKVVIQDPADDAVEQMTQKTRSLSDK